ncbi:hypothetical protein TRIUR3_28184 [Triticum urartu]|uniref:Disease resistance protein At4g27190-like leucine-rich repeats domain-containing protein n=2 Tax=Triticum urartu TaxID=4572 RepID=M7ZJB1_TRIUA|nr:hypothetical protein TRIUR3_28184 [Triticum urartu]
MVTGQPRATDSALEHRATIPTAAAASKTLTQSHPRPAATPTTVGDPQCRDPVGRPKWPPSARPAAPGARRARCCCRARDELSPAVGCETSSVLLLGTRQARSCSTGRETSDGVQLGDSQPFDEGSAQATRRGIEVQPRPLTDGPTPEMTSRSRETIQTTAMSHHHAVAAHIHDGTPRDSPEGPPTAMLVDSATVEEAVQLIIPFLEDTSSRAHKNIYFDGWRGLAASAVLRAIVKDPPPSLLKKFDKIIHLDCSSWKSRRELQRAIAQELKLPRQTPPNRWILYGDNFIAHPESTSLFLAAATSGSDPPLWSLPNDMFHQSENLHVFKLCRCTFHFSSPPFHCCHNLRFLGLDCCQDLQPKEDRKQDTTRMEFFKSLWVIDICNTHWDLPSSPEIIGQMAANIREMHIRRGSFWHIIFASGQLHDLRKLRVIDPTCSWETGGKDEFTVLPSLSTSTSLKTLVLDGCVGLEHVEGLPPSLESFILDARPRNDDFKEAKISHISLVGCARLSDFTLRRSLPNLEELDLSGTGVKTLDLTTQVVQVPRLHNIILLGCLQLHCILWPEKGLPTLTMLHIGTSVCPVQIKQHDVYVTIMDLRFFQSLVLQSNARFNSQFCWTSTRFYINLCVPCTTNVKGQSQMKKKMGPCNSGQIMAPPIPKSLTPNTYTTYIDISVGNIIIDHSYNNRMQFQPSGCHVEIGMEISNAGVESEQAINAIIFAMNKAKSLHVHENSSITTVILSEHMISLSRMSLRWKDLKECHVVRCPKMHTVFTINYYYPCFHEIQSFWAADLLMVHCIWSKGRTHSGIDNTSFVKLKSIHLYSCPRLKFVLPLLWTISRSYLPNLENLHIVNCGYLKTVFPVHPGLRESVLEFPSLKHIHLYELPKLQHICVVKMLTLKLERVWLRGCWTLRRLPAVGRDSHPVVDCEKDWWEKLEWDGLEAGHHPSLFEPRHSSYYKMPLERVSILW